MARAERERARPRTKRPAGKYSRASSTGPGWAPSHGVGLKLNQPLVGQSLTFCSIFTPAHLVGRKYCKLKVLWLGWCSNSSTGSLASLSEMPGSGSISPIAGVPLIDSSKFPLPSTAIIKEAIDGNRCRDPQPNIRWS